MITTSVRIAARILTGSTYAILGAAAYKSPGGRVEQARPLLNSMRRVVPLPDDDVAIVRANGALQATSGTLLALGLFPRAAAVALAVSLVPTTLAGHAFWAIEDPNIRYMQRTQFHKNMAMIGGLLFAALDGKRSK